MQLGARTRLRDRLFRQSEQSLHSSDHYIMDLGYQELGQHKLSFPQDLGKLPTTGRPSSKDAYSVLPPYRFGLSATDEYPEYEDDSHAKFKKLLPEV